MKKTTTTTKPKSIDLSVLQTSAEDAAKRLRAAQKAFTKAAEEHAAAIDANERARIALNQGVAALKASIAVSDIYAQ